jgi:hypothetical protein
MGIRARQVLYCLAQSVGLLNLSTRHRTKVFFFALEVNAFRTLYSDFVVAKYAVSDSGDVVLMIFAHCTIRQGHGEPGPPRFGR